MVCIDALVVNSQYTANLSQEELDGLPSIRDRRTTDLSLNTQLAGAKTTRLNMIGQLLESNTDISAIRTKASDAAFNTISSIIDIYETGTTLDVSDRKLVKKNVAPMGQLVNNNDTITFNNVGGSETLVVTRDSSGQYTVTHNGNGIGTYSSGNRLAIGSALLTFDDGSAGAILDLGAAPRERRARISHYGSSERSSAIAKVSGTLYPN